MELFKIAYFKLRYIIAVGSVFHAFAHINSVTGAEMPSDYTWGEQYRLKIEYFKKRSNGIDCTFDDVEKEYLDDWNKRFQEAYRNFVKEREKEGYDWWV